ncbi:MAG: aryl-sulfate sulfotransferase [Chitinispirillaceae bacterium]|nr:aryl-sulfate sulfotransferase [Chitinispirillaceae bacterium]
MSGRRITASLAVTLFMLTGIFNTVFALSEGYVLGSAFSAKTTELFDKDGNIIFTWSHTVSSGYSCYLLENGNLLRTCNPSGLKIGQGAAPVNGVIQEVDLDGTVLWADTIADVNQSLHHDFKPIKKPDGSINILAVSFVTTTKEEAVAAGVDSTLFASSGHMGALKSFQAEKIIEIKPDRTGAGNSQIVWQWTMLDHVTPTDQASARPERYAGFIASLYFTSQWVHLNGIDYNAKKDLIVFSSRVFSEVYVIDHSTTTELARGSTGGTYGKGGDILYRWGHPSNYIVQFKYDTTIREADTTYRKADTTYIKADTTVNWKGDTVITKADTVYTPAKTIITPADTTIVKTKVGQPGDLVNCLHCPTWIPEGYRNAGNIMFFHNNDDANMKQLGFSQAMEINPWDAGGNLHPLTAGSPTAPLQPTWVYNSVDSMYSASMSSALRMKNGNTLVHETYPGGNGTGKSSTIREVNPAGQVVDSVLTLKKPTGYNAPKIMYYPEDYPGIAAVLAKKTQQVGQRESSFSSMAQPGIRFIAGRIAFSHVAGAVISVYSLQGRRMAMLRPSTDAADIPTASLPTGTFLVKILLPGRESIDRVFTAIH